MIVSRTHLKDIDGFIEILCNVIDVSECDVSCTFNIYVKWRVQEYTYLNLLPVLFFPYRAGR